MSSDYLEDVEDGEGTVVLLTMSVSGFAKLTVMEETEGAIASLFLIPNETGWNNANKIANALNEWVEHTKRIV